MEIGNWLFIFTPPLMGGEHKGRVVIYPPLLACLSRFFNNGRLPLPPGERKCMKIVYNAHEDAI